MRNALLAMHPRTVNCVDVEGMDGSSIFLRLRKSNGFAPEGSILYIFFIVNRGNVSWKWDSLCMIIMDLK